MLYFYLNEFYTQGYKLEKNIFINLQNRIYMCINLKVSFISFYVDLLHLGYQRRYIHRLNSNKILNIIAASITLLYRTHT